MYVGCSCCSKFRCCRSSNFIFPGEWVRMGQVVRFREWHMAPKQCESDRSPREQCFLFRPSGFDRHDMSVRFSSAGCRTIDRQPQTGCGPEWTKDLAHITLQRVTCRQAAVGRFVRPQAAFVGFDLQKPLFLC